MEAVESFEYTVYSLIVTYLRYISLSKLLSIVSKNFNFINYILKSSFDLIILLHSFEIGFILAVIVCGTEINISS